MVRDAANVSQDMLVLENMDMSVFNRESLRSYRQRMRLYRAPAMSGRRWRMKIS